MSLASDESPRRTIGNSKGKNLIYRRKRKDDKRVLRLNINSVKFLTKGSESYLQNQKTLRLSSLTDDQKTMCEDAENL